MTTDPHFVPYGSLNLHPQMWVEFQKSVHMSDLSTAVKKIVDENQVAVVPDLLLENMSFEATWGTEISASLVPGYSGSHWSGLAICIMSHSMMENFPEEQVTRFYKSPYNNEAYLPENIVKIDDPTCRWGKNVLKSQLNRIKVPETLKESPQLSLF